MVQPVFDRAAALQELSRCSLGHRARTARLVRMAHLLSAEAAGRSLPDPHPGRLRRRVEPHEPADGDPVRRPRAHYQATRERMERCPGVALIISDTTELDDSGLRVACLGPIGNGGGRGFECHNSVAIHLDTGDLLGLTSQILHVRETDAQIQAARAATGSKGGPRGPAAGAVDRTKRRPSGGPGRAGSRGCGSGGARRSGRCPRGRCGSTCAIGRPTRSSSSSAWVGRTAGTSSGRSTIGPWPGTTRGRCP